MLWKLVEPNTAKVNWLLAKLAKVSMAGFATEVI